MSVLKDRYEKEIKQSMLKDMNLSSIMAVPKIEKIIINMGVKMAVSDKKYVDSAVEELTQIAGQRAIITRAKKSIANFKLRQGMPIGCRVTLRGERMYDFLERLIFIALPRVRDFQGIPRRGFDGNGNYIPTGKAEILYGEMHESIGCSEFNSGMFDVIKELGTTQAVIVGHDHINDFCAKYDGIYLVYAQCDGYNTYTMGSNFGWDEKDWMQGVTMIDIDKDGKIVFRQRFNRDYL